jgi:pimeloyl-ACP methyl ester carboxylesterase
VWTVVSPSSPAPTDRVLDDNGNEVLEPLFVVPFGERVATFESSNGVRVPTYDWGGDGPPLVFAHATGLHAHVWIPLVTRMRAHFHCYGIDVRGQGNANLPSDGNLTWPKITQDYAAALDGLGLSGRSDVFGIGHSQGGFGLITAELERPGTFSHIFGFEPVLYPLPAGQTPDTAVDNHMSVVAIKRREIFASRAAAYVNYQAKLPFRDADDDVTRCYAQWGFSEIPDGTVRLKCRAATEAALFANSGTQAFERIHTIGCRVTLGLSEFTTPNFAESIPLAHKEIPNSEVMHFPGRTHFGILRGTDEIASTLTSLFLGEDTPGFA